jgi:hypothetical protein
MKNNSWPSFSFTDLLRPPDGWRTEHAILTTYSADLVVIITALLALTGCDLDHRRTGSRVELVKAIDALRGRVRFLTQKGRVTVPNVRQPILKLLDKFLLTVETDEGVSSWHPKLALVCHQNIADESDRQWRVWLGSRNLTRAINWEAGLILVSRADGRGRQVTGLAEVASHMAGRASLSTLPATEIAAQFATLTWECPPGSEVQNVKLLGPQSGKGFPKPPADAERVIIVSPFLDGKTVRAVAGWGNAKTRRTLVSTTPALQHLQQKNEAVFSGYENLLVLPLPDLPGVGAELLDEAAPDTAETAESEEAPPAGLHAKLFFAAKGKHRQLWLGSANATERGWKGRNFEAVSELTITRESAEAIEEFVARCELFTPNAVTPGDDEDEEALEYARKLICNRWSLRQQFGEDEVDIVASSIPPIEGVTIRLEVAVLGGAWHVWPLDKSSMLVSGVRRRQRSNFLQLRLSRGDKMCAWLYVSPCEPPPDEERDRALIAEYLGPHTFLVWLRSVLADRPANAAGGDWDEDPPGPPGDGTSNGRGVPALDLVPTLEEILKAWARDPSAFVSADEKVRSYFHEIERHARENGAAADVEMLEGFRRTWETLAAELR